MKKTALEALAEVVRQYDITILAHHDEQNNATSIEIKAVDNQIIKVDIVGDNCLVTKHDLGIGIGLSRE